MHDENYFNLNEFMDRFDIKKNLCMFKLPKNGGESIITSQSRLMPERLQSPIFIAAQVLYPLCLKVMFRTIILIFSYFLYLDKENWLNCVSAE